MLLTLEGHFRLWNAGLPVRVWVDGRDVSRDCVAADNAHGWAVLLIRENGRAVWDTCTRGLQYEVIEGRVRFATPYGDLPLRWTPGLMFTFLRTSLS